MNKGEIMKKAIITGATGFVGSNLCRKLIDEGFDVGIIIRTSSKLTNIEDIKNNLNIFEYDGDIKSLINYFNEFKADVVFHLASLFIAEHETKDIDNLIDSNIKFGLQILEAMKKSDTKILINTGTSWQHFHVNEYNPVDLYASTKEAFECLIKYYVEAENLKCITLKLFDTYGEMDTRPKLINLLNKFSDEGKVLDMSKGEQVLDLVHISDVTDAFVKAYEYIINNDIKYNEFGIGTGKPIQLKQLIDIFEEVTGKKININWGARPYRKREVMEVWSGYKVLPNWDISINIRDGLKLYSNK